jgi:Ricin-type beta-trefoil lectin domain-like
MNASLTETLSKASLLRAAWLATVALLAACGGGGGSMPEAVAPATADRAEAAAAPAAAVRIEGVYRLENRCSGKVLDVAGVSTALRARIHLWEWWGGANQQWRIEPLGDGTHRLVAQHSGRVLDAPPDAVNEDGVPLFHQWDWHGGANQRFVIDDLGDGSHRRTARRCSTCAAPAPPTARRSGNGRGTARARSAGC